LRTGRRKGKGKEEEGRKVGGRRRGDARRREEG
jgi:hypothetical protein